MTIWLGLGSNLGNRRENLEKAICRLQSRGFELSKTSALVETPAWLPDHAEPSWNKPYLNCVIAGQADWSPAQSLNTVKEIERQLGRQPARRWAPRPIDIDILLWHDLTLQTPELTIPHYGISERPFVLTPLMHLQPDLVIPGQHETVFELCRKVRPTPYWMGILNITPDSFSDGGQWADDEALDQRIEDFIQHHVQIIDIGAESTRPGAAPVSAEEEWRRLEPVLTALDRRLRHSRIRPAISVDSRHWQTLEKAINRGAQIINDVTGLQNPDILALVKQSQCQVVAMHSVTIPADPAVTLPAGQSAVRQLQDWLDCRIDQWLDAGIDLNRVIFDPGIGFGKNAFQSIELLQDCISFKQAGLRLLVGHSRKSFIGGFSDHPFANRDPETLGISLALCEKGVDIIRVHDPVLHVRAWRAWSHVSA